MSIWVFLWFVLSAILIFFSVWTLHILLQQKRAWRVFADKYKLTYQGGRLFDSPSVSGLYKNYSISLFTGEHAREDIRNNRKLTAIEVEVESALPMEGAIGTHGMADIVRGLDYAHRLKSEEYGWGQEAAIRIDEPAMLQKYLTEERVQALSELMKVVNAWVIFIFVRNKTLLRLDMPNPLQNPKKMDVLLNKMIEVARVMELDKAEKTALEKMRGKEATGPAAPGASVLDVSEEASVSFELEEDDEDEKPDASDVPSGGEQDESTESSKS